MTRILCLITLLVGAANAWPDAHRITPPTSRPCPKSRRPTFSGYLAEVEVSLGGVTRYGRIIVTRDGCVHLEHLDEQGRRWVHRVIRQESSTSKGWDDRPLRAGPVRQRLGSPGPE